MYNVKEHERSVTGNFRQTGKSFPVIASEFTGQILQPLKEASAPLKQAGLDLAPLNLVVFGPVCLVSGFLTFLCFSFLFGR